MRALVTGGAGFLGSCLVDRLLAEGWAVEVIDDLSSGSLANLADARADRSNELRIHQHDLREPATAQLVERIDPDVVFHLAGAAGSSGGAAAVLGVAAQGTFHLLEGARRTGRGKVVAVLPGPALHAGAAPGDLPLRESAEPSPTGPVGIAAAGVLSTLRAFRRRHQLEHTALLVPTLHGPRQRPPAGPVAALAAASIAGGAAVLPGSASSTVDLLFVDDAVDAVVRAADRGGGLVLHVATGIELALGDLVSTAAECGAEVPVEWEPAGADQPERHALDAGRAAIHLGWEPFTDLATGLRAVLSDARERAAG